MDTIVKYLRSETGFHENAKILDLTNDKIVDYKSNDGKVAYIVTDGSSTYSLGKDNAVILIPYAVNNDYKIQGTVYCFDTICEGGVLQRGFFGTLVKIDENQKQMFGIEPLINFDLDLSSNKDKLYWSNEIVNVIGTIDPSVKWIKQGDHIKVSKLGSTINSILRIVINLKVKCPTCQEFHPH